MLLYNANLSPNALRVRAVAQELGIALDIVEVDLRKGENRSEAFLALNPNAKVPVLVDDDFVLWESRAINAYLASLKSEQGLYPEDPRKRAIVDQWSYWQATHLGPAMQRVAFERLLKSKFGMGEPDEKALEGPLKDIAQFLAVLDENLSDKDWVAGELSIADFAVASTFVYRKGSNISLESAPHVSRWIDRLEARSSMAGCGNAHVRIAEQLICLAYASRAPPSTARVVPVIWRPASDAKDKESAVKVRRLPVPAKRTGSTRACPRSSPTSARTVGCLYAVFPTALPQPAASASCSRFPALRYVGASAPAHRQARPREAWRDVLGTIPIERL